MKFLILLGAIAVTLGVSAAQSSSCIAYSGTACSSVFGAANITDITSMDSVIELATARLRDRGFSEACQNYFRITQCLTYVPCPGTAWCGSMSPDDLTAAFRMACTGDGNQSTLTNNYHHGSSSTGPVGRAMLACQDVNLISAAGTMKMSVMGAALVAIFLSIGLLL